MSAVHFSEIPFIRLRMFPAIPSLVSVYQDEMLDVIKRFSMSLEIIIQFFFLVNIVNYIA